MSPRPPSFSSSGQRGSSRGGSPPQIDPHRQIDAQLAQLANLIATVRSGAALDRAAQEAARQSHIFFTTVALNHHIDEERSLFEPLMARGDKDLRAKLMGLRQEHELLKSLWLKIAPALDAVARGHRWRDMAEFKSTVEAFVQLYRVHIAAEDLILLSKGDVHEPS